MEEPSCCVQSSVSPSCSFIIFLQRYRSLGNDKSSFCTNPVLVLLAVLHLYACMYIIFQCDSGLALPCTHYSCNTYVPSLSM